MNDSDALVGFDTGILISGFLRERISQELNLCEYILEYAKNRAFRVLLLQGVLDEFTRRLEEEGRLSVIDNELREFKEQCITVYQEPPSTSEIEQWKPVFLPKMRHESDVVIAIAVRKARPHYFVSANSKHWKPSLGPLLGDTQVLQPHEFGKAIGILDSMGRRKG